MFGFLGAVGMSNLGCKIGAMLIACVFAGCAGQAYAQTDSGPTCTPKTIAIAQSPAVQPVEFNPIDLPPACADTTGQVLTVTAVSTPATIPVDNDGHSRNRLRLDADIAPGNQLTVLFTVTDENGEQAQSQVTVTRPASDN